MTIKQKEIILEALRLLEEISNNHLKEFRDQCKKIKRFTRSMEESVEDTGGNLADKYLDVRDTIEFVKNIETGEK